MSDENEWVATIHHVQGTPGKIFENYFIKIIFSTDEYEDQTSMNQSEPPKTEWMSKIEMSTYDGPARRLWMGPQFKFSIQNNGFDCFNRTSAVLHSEEEMKQSAPLPIARYFHISKWFSSDIMILLDEGEKHRQGIIQLK